MRKPDMTALEKLLGRRSKADLTALLLDLAAEDPVLGIHLQRRLQREARASLRRQQLEKAQGQLLRITTPDFASIQRGFSALLECGAHDRLLDLAPQLLSLGADQIARQPDTSAVVPEITACAQLVFVALERIDWRLVDKLIWYWECLLQDHYSLLESLPAPVNESFLPPRDWREAAEYFQIRLGELLQSADEPAYRGPECQRGELVEQITDALMAMGEVDAVTEVLISELPHTQCYLELIDHLADHGHEREAETWARQGFGMMIESEPDVAWALERYLVSLARRSMDARLVAAFRVQEFLADPSLQSYRAVRVATRVTGCWEVVQACLLNWLEFAESPYQATDWPLPATGLHLGLDHHPIMERERNLQLLVEITLEEGEIDYAVLCFERMHWQRNLALRIAQEAVETQPEVSREFLERIIESLINEVRVKSYLLAQDYLRRLQALCFRHHWQAKFADFVNHLRQAHGAKQRLMKILDEVETSPQELKLVGGRDTG